MSSNIVLGNQDSEEYECNMMTSYGKELSEKAKDFKHTPETQREKLAKRNNLRDKMRNTSVLLGFDAAKPITHYDSEFREIQYIEESNL